LTVVTNPWQEAEMKRIVAGRTYYNLTAEQAAEIDAWMAGRRREEKQRARAEQSAKAEQRPKAAPSAKEKQRAKAAQRAKAEQRAKEKQRAKAWKRAKVLEEKKSRTVEGAVERWLEAQQWDKSFKRRLRSNN
jgi:hypothetical protein